MTDYWFGGTEASYVVSVGAGNAVVFEPGAEVKAWATRTGADQLDALIDEAGQPITAVRANDGTDPTYPLGGLPRFKAPAAAIWLGADGEARVLAVTTDLPEMIAAVSAVANRADAAIDSHSADRNGHQTGVADLTDVQVPPAEQRPAGQVFGTLAGGVFGLLAPAQAAGAVLLDPPRDAGGNYVGNVAAAPDPSQGQNGEPWLKMQAGYSAGDNNPDMLQLFSTSQSGQPIKTGWWNGNGEIRAAPSAVNRVAMRAFEAYENRGGPSTGRFFELSTNPLQAANREPLLGAYGTANASKPGWVEATRILSALKGVSAGGNHNALSPAVFRGRSANVGAPVAGVWLVGDVILDAAGVLWMCTAAGEPGQWIGGGGGGGGAAPPSAYVDVTPAADMAHGAKHCASRLERGEDAGRLRGTLTATAAVASGDTLATIDADHRPQAVVTGIARSTGGGAKLTINPDGTITYGSSFNAGQELWLDSVTYDLLP